MSSKGKDRRLRVRTLFLSDVHLGFKRARTRELLAFLRGVDAETIVLGGDIVDALSLAKRFYWTDEHTQVLRLLLARRRSGVRLVYLPGNHDASVAVFVEMLQGQIEVHRRSPAVETMPALSTLPQDFREAFFGGLDYAIVGSKLI